MAATAEHAVSAWRQRAAHFARDFGPLAIALATGAVLGAAARATQHTPRGLFELTLVLAVAASVAGAILPREAEDASFRRRDLRALFRPVIATQRAFAIFAFVAAAASTFAHGFGTRELSIPLVLALQFALAVGLALFAAAVTRTRLGRRIPARWLIPAWVLASPGAWLVHAQTSEFDVGWNPLHHLVAAWRAILLPGIGADETLETAIVRLAPVALLFALLGFATFAAVEPREDPVSS